MDYSLFVSQLKEAGADVEILRERTNMTTEVFREYVNTRYSAPSVVIFTFNWEGSPEGSQYWSEVTRKLRQIING